MLYDVCPQDDEPVSGRSIVVLRMKFLNFVWNRNSIRKNKNERKERARCSFLSHFCRSPCRPICIYFFGFFFFSRDSFLLLFGGLFGMLKRRANENKNARKQSNQNHSGVCVSSSVVGRLEVATVRRLKHTHTHHRQRLLFLCK